MPGLKSMPATQHSDRRAGPAAHVERVVDRLRRAEHARQARQDFIRRAKRRDVEFWSEQVVTPFGR
jgi:hypothetical protein